MNVSPPPFKPIAYQREPPPDAPRDIASLTNERIRDRCVTEYRQLQALFDSLYELTAPWQKGDRERTVDRIHTHLSKRYLPAINELREATTPEGLQQLSRTLARRLNEGWELESTPQRDDLWERLIVEKCIVMDATSRHVIRIHLSRLQGLESSWPS